MATKHIRPALSGTAWLCLATTALLIAGCKQGEWNGIYTADTTGGARVCSAPTATLQDGQSIQAQIQVSNEGGWCAVTANRGGVPFDSYLMVDRPNHGNIFAHRVGKNTRIDYTPEKGFTGTDGFTVRLIPGNAVLHGAVRVTP